MKVLIIGTTDKLGGAAKISWQIKDELEKQGHSVSMFVANKKSNDPKVQVIPIIKWRKILGFLLSSEDFIKTDWILKTREFQEADIIHCHNLHGRFFNLRTLEKMSKLKPIIWTLHDEWAITPHCACTFENNEIRNGLFVCKDRNIPPRILWNNTKYLCWRKNQIYKNTNLNLVVPSLWLKNKTEKTILKEKKIYLIKNGTDTEIFKIKDKTKMRKKLNLPQNKKIVLFIADNSTKSPWKGWKYTRDIIKKYENNKDLLFINIGGHNNEKDTENIKYIKYIDDDNKISEYYNACDAMVFTSISENFPLVILEAMACGLPIVSFDVGGVKEVLEHKVNGYISDYKDTLSLEKGFKYILNLPKKDLDEMGRNSSEKIKSKFSLKEMNSKYINLYKNLINHDNS